MSTGLRDTRLSQKVYAQYVTFFDKAEKERRWNPFQDILWERINRDVPEALVLNARLTVHLRLVEGRDPHHIAEAEFKAFARALRQAKALDPLVSGVPSTKGAL